jgi:hypothetical protein
VPLFFSLLGAWIPLGSRKRHVAYHRLAWRATGALRCRRCDSLGCATDRLWCGRPWLAAIAPSHTMAGGGSAARGGLLEPEPPPLSGAPSPVEDLKI